MGEIADLKIDGITCEQCGVFLEGADMKEPPGYPRCCTYCAKDPEVAETYKGRIVNEYSG